MAPACRKPTFADQLPSSLAITSEPEEAITGGELTGIIARGDDVAVSISIQVACARLDAGSSTRAAVNHNAAVICPCTDVLLFAADSSTAARPAQSVVCRCGASLNTRGALGCGMSCSVSPRRAGRRRQAGCEHECKHQQPDLGAVPDRDVEDVLGPDRVFRVRGGCRRLRRLVRRWPLR